MEVKIAQGWKTALSEEFDKPYFKALVDFLKKEYRTGTVFPEGKNIFNAFNYCDFDEARVVILGQDPYHGPGQANGLAFSVPPGFPHPPSLKNILRELSRDIGCEKGHSGDLSSWAKQGVLLLNAILTVHAGQAGSHEGKGWEEFTDAVVKKLSEHRKGLVFILWGGYAQRKGQIIDSSKHLILQAPHPSPLSAYRGFLGCGHFSQANEYLRQSGKGEIDWCA
jgi:uracil-DNA glycosylase